MYGTEIFRYHLILELDGPMFTGIFLGFARWLSLGALLAAYSLPLVAQTEIPRPEHPRPDFQRDDWQSLNGRWIFRTDPGDQGIEEEWFAESLDDELVLTLYEPIEVPFPWESELSGQATNHKGIAWYRRSFDVPESWRNKRVFAIFGAVDHHAEVWVNGTKITEHDGGYTPFECEIGTALRDQGFSDVTVRVVDEVDPETPTGMQSRGFTPSSGIWQSVYLETRPATRFAAIRFRSPQPETGKTTVTVELVHDGHETAGRLQIDFADQTIPDIDLERTLRRGHQRFEHTFNIENPQLWQTHSPTLYECVVRITDAHDTPGDAVSTYFALRSVRTGSDLGRAMVHLNGHPIYLRGVIHGGLHPEGLYSHPSDDAIRKDIESALSFGFNTIRVRSKLEDPRFYYWCDRLGCLVVQDLPSFEVFGSKSRSLAESTLRAAVDRDFNHPSIIARVLFPENRGVAAGGYNATRVDWVQSMVRLARELDDTRLVVDTVGRSRDHIDTDLAFWSLDANDYDGARAALDARKNEPLGKLFLSGTATRAIPRILGEFRGVQAGAGDRDVSSSLSALLSAITPSTLQNAGFFYGALTDTEWDHAGLLNYDRTPKEFGSPTADIAGPVFIGLDGPQILEAVPESSMVVPLFLTVVPGSHRKMERMSLQLDAIDHRGNVVLKDFKEISNILFVDVLANREVELPPEPLTGALRVTMFHQSDRPPTTRHFPIIAKPEKADQPLATFDDGKLIALRFGPREFADVNPAPIADRQAGLLRLAGKGYVEYRLRIPDGIPLEAVTAVGFEAEMAAAGDERLLDWPAVRRLTDQPQTDGVETPSRVVVSLADKATEPFVLRTAPNDARGVLSRASGYPHAIYGEVKRVWIEEPSIESRDVDIRVEVTRGAGLALFGRSMGRTLLGPALLLRLDRALDTPQDFAPTKVIRERLGDRGRVLVPTAERAEIEWSYTVHRPLKNWTAIDFDDGAWPRGRAAFGDVATERDEVRTAWETPAIWLRHVFDALESDVDKRMFLRLKHREGVEVFLNGEPILTAYGSCPRYETVALADDILVTLQSGRNVLAVRCDHTLAMPFVDVGLLVDQSVK